MGWGKGFTQAIASSIDPLPDPEACNQFFRLCEWSIGDTAICAGEPHPRTLELDAVLHPQVKFQL